MQILVGLLFGFISLLSCWAGTNFSSQGFFASSQDPDRECGHLRLCTPKNLTFHLFQGTPREAPLDHISGCAVLERSGVHTLYFSGDSYMRHIFLGLYYTLSGNYTEGVNLKNSVSFKVTKDSIGIRQVCPQNGNGKGVKMVGDRFMDEGREVEKTLNFCDNQEQDGGGSLILYSVGNHPLNEQWRSSVNNFIDYQNKLKSDDNLCANNKIVNPYSGPHQSGLNKSCSLWWVSTHYRMHAYWGEETPERVQEFNEHMKNFFSAKKCGNVNTIDVHDMTACLSKEHRDEALQLTYDKVHWGLEVNLMKAQIILAAFANAAAAEKGVLDDDYENKTGKRRRKTRGWTTPTGGNG